MPVRRPANAREGALASEQHDQKDDEEYEPHETDTDVHDASLVGDEVAERG